MPKLAVLVVDMLNDFFLQRPELAAQREELTTAINSLVDQAHRHGHPVIWVRQEFRPDLSDSFLDMRKNEVRVTIEGTDGCEMLPELHRFATDLTIIKKRYSAFFKTNLEERLKSLRPDILVLSGINTHACVRMTAIDAYQRDYEVVIAADCVGSYDQEHHHITMRYLEGGIARVMSNPDILRVLASA